VKHFKDVATLNCRHMNVAWCPKMIIYRTSDGDGLKLNKNLSTVLQ